MERETSTSSFAIRQKLDLEGTAQYILDKYDGAFCFSVRANAGQRL